jgi:hypothetical protein
MGFDQITWITGTYEKHAAEFIGNIYGIKMLYYNDGFPTDIHSREDFHKQVKAMTDYGMYDQVFANFRGSFEFEPEWEFTPEEMLLPITKVEKKDHIVVQASSSSCTKIVDGLFHVSFPLQVISVGGKNERRIPDSINLMGYSWDVVCKAICESRFYVGIHSAATCLAFYTGVPMIVCDFGRNFDFSKYRKCISQIPDMPNRDQIQAVVDTYASKYLSGVI